MGYKSKKTKGKLIQMTYVEIREALVAGATISNWHRRLVLDGDKVVMVAKQVQLQVYYPTKAYFDLRLEWLVDYPG